MANYLATYHFNGRAGWTRYVFRNLLFLNAACVLWVAKALFLSYALRPIYPDQVAHFLVLFIAWHRRIWRWLCLEHHDSGCCRDSNWTSGLVRRILSLKSRHSLDVCSICQATTPSRPGLLYRHTAIGECFAIFKLDLRKTSFLHFGVTRVTVYNVAPPSEPRPPLYRGCRGPLLIFQCTTIDFCQLPSCDEDQHWIHSHVMDQPKNI